MHGVVESVGLMWWVLSGLGGDVYVVVEICSVMRSVALVGANCKRVCFCGVVS